MSKILKRYKITMEYDGTNFIGWQRQNVGCSIQGVIEESIYMFSNERVTVYGAGRTDAGVHARKQVAHFDIYKEMTCYQIQGALNHFLRPHLISIIAVEEVDSNFHARFHAKQRSYVYKIINRSVKPSLFYNKAWHVAQPLNVENMQIAALSLLGKHDFSSFRAAGCQARHATKTIDIINIHKLGDDIEIYIAAPSFLYHQVRIIVGTLVKIGGGEWGVDEMAKVLSAQDRTKAGPTAAAHGLYFYDVKYSEAEINRHPTFLS